MIAPSAAIDLDTLARELATPAVPPEESWRPIVVRLAVGEGWRLAELCGAHGVAVIDTIDRQLADLAAIRLPAGSVGERRRFVDDLVAAHEGPEAFGDWVYLPWERKIAHLLGRDAYFDVITNRNLDKIARGEQLLLRTKRVGVVGLSVGGEAAVTVAQEHLCGHVVLADFDLLDLSNLNRLNAGFDELGLSKAKIVARRIARIDPYLDVTILEDGVTAANVHDFLDGLDLLVEECDGLQMKRELRILARERGLNIVFAADERGFLSIEPHAHAPELLPFHGRVEQPQPARESFATSLDFMRALSVWMGGWDALSERSRRTLERIGDTHCGYPQLASEARFAAGQIGHVARRLLLGEPLAPFIGNIDLDQLIPAR